MRKAVACCIEIGGINLPNISAEHDLRPITNARNNCLDFVRRKILRFIHNDELVRNASASDICDRLQNQFARSNQLIDALLGGFAIGLGPTVTTTRRQEICDIVEDRLHPRREYLYRLADIQYHDQAA